MAHNIVVGRNESDRKKLGEKGTIFLGKHYVKMGETTSLSNKVYMDVAKAHVVLVAGKRGSGKSWTLGVLAEEMSNLPEDVAKNLAVVIFDTMGIFWTMKFANEREEALLKQWDLESKSLDIDIYTPKGFHKEYKEKGIPTDYSFAIKTSELNAGDWCNTFDVKLTDPIGILVERVLEDIKETKGDDYDIYDIINLIQQDKRSDKATKDAAENRFAAAKAWGLFDKEGTEIKDLVQGGRVSVLDVSCYTNVSGDWGIKGLVIGLISRKLLAERITARKEEELSKIKTGEKYFISEDEEKEEMPLVWILIDEAHEFLPRTGKSPATDALVQLLREGRQPGVSLVLATQQPGEIHKDVMTQSDIVISHRLTSKLDIDALNSMMQTYLVADLQKYLNNLPKLMGSAIVLDDNSERIYPMRVRPRFTWHGGETPSAVKVKKTLDF